MTAVAAISEKLRGRGLLRDYPECPVCRDSARDPIDKPPYYDMYILALADGLEIGADTIMEVFQTYECARCGSLYSDPWLSAAGMDMLYGHGRSQHVLGWQDFYRWLQEPPDSVLAADKKGLWAFLSAVAGGATSYAELNCPFQGLLMHFRELDLAGTSKRRFAAEQITDLHGRYLQPFDRDNPVNRLSWFAARAKRKLLGTAPANARLFREQFNVVNPNRMSRRNVMRSLGLRRFRNNHNQSAAHVPGAPPPERRLLVLEHSAGYWCTNCTSMNCSCRAIANTVLATPAIGMADLRRENIGLDVFALFNCLDHFVDPKAILSKAVEAGRLVYLDVHASGEGHNYYRQHLFACGKAFLEHIAEDDWHIADVTDMVKKRKQNAYLISKAIDVKAQATKAAHLLPSTQTRPSGDY